MDAIRGGFRILDKKNAIRMTAIAKISSGKTNAAAYFATMSSGVPGTGSDEVADPRGCSRP